jgi:FAD-dependent oxidoreductase domain-containing protein 1
MNNSATSSIVVIGGGIIGSSVACALAEADAGVSVKVIEPDPSYEWAATPRATGTIRRVFTLAENIHMSNLAHEVYSNFDSLTAVNGEVVADVQFNKGGFLYMAWGKKHVAHLKRIQALVAPHYPEIDLLDASAISSRFPSISTEGVDVGLFAPDDGWIDPASALQGYAKKAKSLGAVYVKDRVVGFATSGHQVTEVQLGSGERIKADSVVNCANCWAAEVASMIGMQIPIRPLRRMTYYFDTRAELEPLPLTRDINGISVRPEGSGYIAGVTNYNEEYGFNWDLDYDWFNGTVWPAIATRIPAFEAVKLQSCWSGHYDINTLDQTAIIGPWTGGIENFYVAAGFSGHGLQQAPAVGRAIKELLLDGGYQTIDLSRLGYQRVLDGCPLNDEGPGS